MKVPFIPGFIVHLAVLNLLVLNFFRKLRRRHSVALWKLVNGFISLEDHLVLCVRIQKVVENSQYEGS